MTASLSRRAFLTRSAILGCSAAASPLLTPISLAAAPWDQRLVVIILRGAMDGLDVVQPYGDPSFPGLRRTLTAGPAAGALDLDGFFALHPALAPLYPLWQARDLGFVHAVSTPYRDKRSHFDGQDLLEAGTATLGSAAGRDGWLNRLLQSVPGVEAETAYSIGHDNMLLLTGAAPVANWSPDISLGLSPQAVRLAELVMHDDPLFRDAFAEAQALSGSMQTMAENAMMAVDGMSGMSDMATMDARPKGKAKGIELIAEFTAQRLKADTRIAAFSIGGWDTHDGQQRALPRALGQLSQAILTLKAELGPQWKKTTVLAMTEFGRTVRENGTKGTDHGTGGAMLLAGGTVRGGKVYGDWPGLSEADLYQRRDLMPTRDVRAYAGWAMRGLYGFDRSVLEQAVFPGLDLGTDPGILR
ncbi:hypothetical protein TG4357_03290 [Thalassovita gelatinovora]|uniref:Twin-arginine translocation pathway signal n=1 Tax=Thalassovita gelatinovora TaxID=53501 RepID=A0A0P1FJ73_THAGE|nr:DUF1501 domain-containing protein [Thalassovita gelatinovora]QIZ81538.1 DUF1501 domain-containing protein [Thalassovita gelatinovora]CUH67932.1 hypothetical protein TG4357_03290 [Thalassovita gelatinovora]SEQ25731.1 Tat (twin-arginine translocation) pathway signal sequence [Thalassovita gelatinovora]